MKWYHKLLILIVIVATSYAAGRYMTPEKIKIEEKTVYVESKKTEVKTETDRNKHVVTTKTETKLPDGTVTVITKTEEKTNTSRNTNKNEKVDSSSTTEKTSVTEMGRNRITISLMGGIDVGDMEYGLIYGGHITKPLIGPIAVGVFGLSNGVLGMSLGLQF